MEKKNSIIVAAGNNNGRVTYPASFNEVIGVRCSIYNAIPSNTFEFNECTIDGIDITAHSALDNNTIVGNNGIEGVIYETNSYTAPYITALICNILHIDCNNLNEVKAELKRQANTSISDCIYYPYKQYTKLKKKKLIYVDAPNIIVYGYYMDQLIDIARQLCNMFSTDGYQTVYLNPNADDTKNIKEYYTITTNNTINKLNEKIELTYMIARPDLIITIVTDSDEFDKLATEKLVDMICVIDKKDTVHLKTEDNIHIRYIDTSTSDYIAKMYSECKLCLI